MTVWTEKVRLGFRPFGSGQNTKRSHETLRSVLIIPFTIFMNQLLSPPVIITKNTSLPHLKFGDFSCTVDQEDQRFSPCSQLISEELWWVLFGRIEGGFGISSHIIQPCRIQILLKFWCQLCSNALGAPKETDPLPKIEPALFHSFHHENLYEVWRFERMRPLTTSLTCLVVKGGFPNPQRRKCFLEK